MTMEQSKSSDDAGVVSALAAISSQLSRICLVLERLEAGQRSGPPVATRPTRQAPEDIRQEIDARLQQARQKAEELRHSHQGNSPMVLATQIPGDEPRKEK